MIILPRYSITNFVPLSLTLIILPLSIASLPASWVNSLALAEIGVRRDAVMVSTVKARLMGVNIV